MAGLRTGDHAVPMASALDFNPLTVLPAKVLAVLREADTAFYLTAGTAASQVFGFTLRVRA